VIALPIADSLWQIRNKSYLNVFGDFCRKKKCIKDIARRAQAEEVFSY
jgi:hypothetical protein